MTICRMLPEMILPVLVIRLGMTTAMLAGTLVGGDALLPGEVVQVPPQGGGVVLRVWAKPLKEDGAGPPERLLRLDHCAPHQATVTGTLELRAALTVRSPSTKEPA